ncbi:hypothetical protein EJ02DRAFT_459531 [Clathrospora elynae]|uniref:Uncharacterized protein n=1 Tax=Clathrospora elynae TaxID=706981 RepID=A0A6A5S710_9PLEO|nr:hypothetical protein EJ02DRAFT_459531 [Clathrospora elynae]
MGEGGEGRPGIAASTSASTHPPNVARNTRNQGSQHGLTDPNLGADSEEQPGIAAFTSASILR